MKDIYSKTYLIFFLSILFVNQSFAQHWERELYFRNISTDEGLSNPTINCIYEDARGFIWIGTIDGLNRYDGYEFKVYRFDPTDSNSIPSNRINALYEDSNYNLWIGTSNGLCQFNYKSDEFRNYKSGDNFDQVFNIAYDNKNKRIWIVSSSGKLKYLDLISGIVEYFNEDRLTNNVVSRVLIIDKDLFIGTIKNGLYKLDLDSFGIEEFCNTQTGRFQIQSDWITALHFYNDQLTIGTENGLIEYSFIEDKTRYYHPQNSILTGAAIYSIAHDSHGDKYIGTIDGMAILNNRTGIISSHRKQEGSLTTLSSNIIRTVFVDHRDDLWVGTIQRGIDYLNKESRSMTLVEKKYGEKNSLSGSSITSFAQDNNGGMWIGTKENGLIYYKNGQYQIFKADGSKHSISKNIVTDICIATNGVVWVSVYDAGLYAFRNGKFELFQMDRSNPDALQSNKIRNLDIDENGILWLATEQGLESFDFKRNIFSHHYLTSETDVVNKRKNIRAILSDSGGKIYAGTNTGLYIYNPISGKSDHFREDLNDSNALGQNTIIDIFEDSKRRIWLGSLGGGLISFDKENKSFKGYTNKNGFPDNSVKTIEEDKQANLWLGTNKGIVKFTPSTERVVIIGKSYGLQSNNINVNASIKCKDGRLIFGGPHGFNVFQPDEVEEEKNNLEVMFTDLKLYERSVRVFDEHDILTKNISMVESLNFLYDQARHFSVSFSALKFSNPEQLQYKYMLEGFDDRWTHIGNDHRISFTNLAPDNYVLKVMASENGLWNNQVKELDIRILAPWYMKLCFKAGLVICLIILVI
jgi:ligand-binding sensor domain-containing protein